MTHTDVISLVDAKTYLGLDDTSRDVEVNRMIKSAISWVEKRTNHILVSKNRDYAFENCKVNVYDYPIGTLPSGVTEEQKSTYSIFTSDSSDTTLMTLPLGYDAIEDVPEDLIEVCYMMLKFFFYEQEGSGKIPESVNETVNNHRRFTI